MWQESTLGAGAGSTWPFSFHTNQHKLCHTHLIPRQRRQYVAPSNVMFSYNSVQHTFWDEDAVMVWSITCLLLGPQMYHYIVLIKRANNISKCVLRNHYSQVWRFSYFILELWELLHGKHSIHVTRPVFMLKYQCSLVWILEKSDLCLKSFSFSKSHANTCFVAQDKQLSKRQHQDGSPQIHVIYVHPCASETTAMFLCLETFVFLCIVYTFPS